MAPARPKGSLPRNDGALLCDNHGRDDGLLLNNTSALAKFAGMSRLLLSTLLCLGLAGAAQAACTAEYKAQRSNPTEFRHAVMTVPDQSCGSVQTATAYVRAQLAEAGWKLLVIVQVSG